MPGAMRRRVVLWWLTAALGAGAPAWCVGGEEPPELRPFLTTRPAPQTQPGPREWRPAKPGPRPTVLFTDFAPDSSTEDWLDVASALLHPGIDLRAVLLEVTTHNDTRPAAVLRQLCADLGRPAPRVFTGSTPAQLAAVRFWPRWNDGVAGLSAWLGALPEGERLTIVSTGRLTNLAEFLRRDEEAVRTHVDRVYVAAGYFHSQNLEYHIELDPAAWVSTMRSGAPIVLVPRDVAGAGIARSIAPATMRRLMAVKGDDCRPEWTSTTPVWMLAARGHDAAAWGAALKVRTALFTVDYPGHTLDCDFDAEKPNIALVTEADRRAMLNFLGQTLEKAATQTQPR